MNRLLLFDIDGTLLRGGPAKAAFGEALLETYGTMGPIEEWEFSGKTDPQIARELLREAGIPDPHIEGDFPRLWAAYLGRLETGLKGLPMELLPGVVPLLDALTELEGAGEVALGIVTGNLARGAELKLASAGLRARWEVGGYGSDHEERNALPAVALDRATTTWGRRFAGQEAVVIGDTPRDVACGRAHGLATIGVATGPFGVDVLVRAGADRVLEDFSDTPRVLESLLGWER
jgi:phosphoglycolate phosphatase